MEKVTVGRVLKYSLLPGIAPRLRDLLGSGFGHAAFFMAQIYFTARLLPAGHPYLNTANVGRFGIRHVIAEAAGNLKFNRRNIDQLAIFGIILIGFGLLIAQLFLLASAIFIQTAHAANLPDNFFGYFMTENPQYDIALIMLERVFGVPGINTAGFFDTCVSRLEPCNPRNPDGMPDSATFPFPFHIALRSMLQLYSVGLLVVAVLIFCYFIVAVAAETAQSGTPFGRRFNHVWAPLRMVVALGLLVPIAQGLNSAQWILLYAAKFGSGFATNGWIHFVNLATEGDSTLASGDRVEQLVAVPNLPPINGLLEFFSVVAACKVANETLYNEQTSRVPRVINAWLVNSNNAGAPVRQLSGTDFATARAHFGQGDIHVQFGFLGTHPGGALLYPSEAGGVKAFCGELKFQVTDIDEEGSPGSHRIHEGYYDIIQRLWEDAAGANADNACNTGEGDWGVGAVGACVAHAYMAYENDPASILPGASELNAMQTEYKTQLQTILLEGTQLQVNAEWVEDMRPLGWGGAGIWYNKIAQFNGALIGAAYNLPNIRRHPEVMEHIKRLRAASDSSFSQGDMFRPYLANNQKVDFGDERDWQIASILYNTNVLWQGQFGMIKPSGNIFIDAINLVFGTEGLFNIVRPSDDEDSVQDIHPLAQLTAIGRGILESSIRNLGWAAGATGVGAVAALFDTHLVGTVAHAASGFLSQVATIGLSIGFVLYYVMPFMPFLYFFFAVGSWIKTIFEAMVGVPLWALAHIRIDGNGLPGDAALGGYQLILEVFLRPILIIFGLLAAVTIFAAQARILNDIWPLVTSNLAGFDNAAAQNTADGEVGSLMYLRSAVDMFFFTVIYTIIIYMLGTSSFKLIDLIPNHILRWLGASVSSFGDQSGDPAENLQRNTLMGANLVGGNLRQAASGASGAVSEAGSFVKNVVKPG